MKKEPKRRIYFVCYGRSSEIRLWPMDSVGCGGRSMLTHILLTSVRVYATILVYESSHEIDRSTMSLKRGNQFFVCVGYRWSLFTHVTSNSLVIRTPVVHANRHKQPILIKPPLKCYRMSCEMPTKIVSEIIIEEARKQKVT